MTLYFFILVFFTSCLYFQCLGLPFQYRVTPPAVVPLRQFVCLANRVYWRFGFPRALQLCPLCWTPGWTACCRFIWWGSCAGISKGQTKWLICWRYLPSPLWHCLDLAALLVCSGLLCRNQEPPSPSFFLFEWFSSHKTYSSDLNPVNLFLMLQPADGLLQVSELPQSNSLNKMTCKLKGFVVTGM